MFPGVVHSGQKQSLKKLRLNILDKNHYHSSKSVLSMNLKNKVNSSTDIKISLKPTTPGLGKKTPVGSAGIKVKTPPEEMEKAILEQCSPYKAANELSNVMSVSSLSSMSEGEKEFARI